MLIKEQSFDLTNESIIGSHSNHCEGECDFLDKTAASTSVSYFSSMDAKKDHVYLLVVAMTAGEFWGPNNNGDYFKTADLKKYYRVFDNAGVFWNHDNKDKSKSSGKVIKSFWNDKMQRIELILELPKEKARYIPDHIAQGIPIRVSMGLSTPCFPKGTKVTMENGEEKSIETIKKGERVFTSNFNVKEVIKTTKTAHSGDLLKIETSEGTLYPTENHKFHVIKIDRLVEASSEEEILENRIWVKAKDLDKSRDYLTSIYNEESRKSKKLSFFSIEKITRIKADEVEGYDGYVYDIVVEDDHSFIANNICVHNSEHCSICGHVTKGSYANRCIHLKFQMNSILDDGRKVYAICGTPMKIFDISIISGRQADKTAYSMLSKVAASKKRGGLSGIL